MIHSDPNIDNKLTEILRNSEPISHMHYGTLSDKEERKYRNQEELRKFVLRTPETLIRKIYDYSSEGSYDPFADFFNVLSLGDEGNKPVPPKPDPPRPDPPPKPKFTSTVTKVSDDFYKIDFQNINMIKGQKINVMVGYEDGSTELPEYYEINFNFIEEIWNDLITSKNCKLYTYKNIIELVPNNLDKEWSIEISGLGSRVPRFYIIPKVSNA